MSAVPGRERMVRSVAIGMAAGMLVGGLALVGLSLSSPQPCDREVSDCSIEQQIASDFAQYQSWFGLALVLLGTALSLYVWAIVRRERRPAQEV